MCSSPVSASSEVLLCALAARIVGLRAASTARCVLGDAGLACDVNTIDAERIWGVPSGLRCHGLRLVAHVRTGRTVQRGCGWRIPCGASLVPGTSEFGRRVTPSAAPVLDLSLTKGSERLAYCE
jgi:hypothetical protein